MKRAVVSVLIAAPLLSGGAYALWPRQGRPERSVAVAAQTQADPVPAADFDLRELFEPGPVLKPSPRARNLVGKRVRIVGFMAQMELPPKGGFYLTPRPTRCDEAGGGTADLPPESVRVIARPAGQPPVPFVAGALEVTGILEIGNQADQDGRVSAFRIRLDPHLGDEAIESVLHERK